MGRDMLKRIMVKITFKTLIAKSICFLIPWSALFYFILKYYPEYIDLNRLVSNIMSNTLVFYICYVLTVAGFQYSAREDKSDRLNKS
jgi:hypothetical protein